MTEPTWWEDEIDQYDEEDDVQHECDYCHGDGGDRNRTVPESALAGMAG